MLTADCRKLQSDADQAAGQSDRARELHGDVSRQESELAATMEGVGALFGLLNTALEDESFTKDPGAAVGVQTELEKEVLRHDDEGGGGKTRRRRRRGGLQSVVARVRATSHRNRTPDEKRWVALDAVLNPGLYHHVTLAEAEEMRWDALYYTKLDREDVRRVLSLPPQIQLALPFLHTPDEVAAHELLTRYSHGMNADHFARLDKDSQDVCRRGRPVSFPSSASAGGASAATAGAGGNIAADGVSMQQGPTNGAGDDTIVGATRRVLACMRRATEAKLKLSAEREDEEAIWCVLDKTLRPDLYRDSDEAAADGAEKLHREADAREDARHTWLATPEETSSRGGTTKMAEVAEAGGGLGMSSVVEQKRKADTSDEAAAAKKAAEDREALVVGVTNYFTEDDIKALAAAAVVVGESCGGAELGQELQVVTTAAIGGEQSAREHEGGRGRAPTSAETSDGYVEAHAFTTPTREAEKHVAPTSRRQDDQRLKPEDDHCDAKTSKGMDGSNQQQAEERRRLVETVKRVLPRFLVSEDETPLGRDMTRSLAMLQEVTLRLGKGQRNVFSGLNPQSALALVRSRWQPSKTVPSTAEDRSTAVAAANIAAAGKREEGKGTMLEETAAVCKGEEETISIEAAAKAPLKGAAEAADGVNADKIKGNSVDTKQRLVDETKTTSRLGSGRGNGGSGESIANTAGGTTISETPRKLEKVFGSWEEIHPAALGIGSQETPYVVTEGNEAHPASFRRSVSSKGARNQNLSSSLFITIEAHVYFLHGSASYAKSQALKRRLFRVHRADRTNQSAHLLDRGRAKNITFLLAFNETVRSAPLHFTLACFCSI